MVERAVHDSTDVIFTFSVPDAIIMASIERRTNMETTLGNRISRLRRDKGLTQEELAEMLGVSPQAVSKWENDQTCPDILLLPELARILEISVDELLSGKKADEPIAKVLDEGERKELKDMMLRILVSGKKGEKVRINIPLSILEVAVSSGMSMAQVSGNSALGNIDLAKILDMARQGAVGNLVEVDTPDGENVRIFVE